MTPRARETSSPNQKQTPSSAGSTTPPASPDQHRFQADRPRRRTAGRGTAAHPPLAGRAPQPRRHPRALPGADHAARPRRRAAAALRVLRARLPGDAAQVCDACRVPGDPLLDPERPRSLPGGGGGGQTPGERHEEPGGAFRALRQPGIRPQGQSTGRPLPPRAQADADRGPPRAGVRSPERAQALPSAPQAGSSGGSGRREFRPVVRRLEGPRASAGPFCGRGSSARGRRRRGRGCCRRAGGGSGWWIRRRCREADPRMLEHVRSWHSATSAPGPWKHAVARLAPAAINLGGSPGCRGDPRCGPILASPVRGYASSPVQLRSLAVP